MKTRVLVIDDEECVANSLAMVLSANGYDVVAEYSGEAGLLRASSFHPDFVFSDVLMPTINGVDTAIRMQQLLPECTIMLLSAVPEVARQLLKSREMEEAFELLAKPLHPRLLLSSLPSVNKSQDK
jgi:CheY-like chemotaxis protein